MFNASSEEKKAGLEHNLKIARANWESFKQENGPKVNALKEEKKLIEAEVADLRTKADTLRQIKLSSKTSPVEREKATLLHAAAIKLINTNEGKVLAIEGKVNTLINQANVLKKAVSEAEQSLLLAQEVKESEKSVVVEPAPEVAIPVEESQVTAAPTVEEPVQPASVEQPEIQETEVEKAKREVLETAKKCETIAEIDKIFVDIKNNRPDIWLLIHDNDPNNVKHSEILAVLGDLLLNQANEDERRRGAGTRTMGVYMSSLTQLLATKFPYDWARYKR